VTKSSARYIGWDSKDLLRRSSEVFGRLFAFTVVFIDVSSNSNSVLSKPINSHRLRHQRRLSAKRLRRRRRRLMSAEQKSDSAVNQERDECNDDARAPRYSAALSLLGGY
jgi:hypothetical protein